MKILVISQYYPPENVPIPAQLAHELEKRGHDVIVLTGFPNYPTGEVFPGYRQRWRHKERDSGVGVVRAPLFADHSQRSLGRIANYASFAVSSATARGLIQGADAVYIYAPQMTAALGPWLWRILGGAPYVVHVQDLWPDSITGSSLVRGGLATQVVEGTLSHWLKSVYRRAAGVVGIAPTMVETLERRGVPRERAHLVYNWGEGTRTEHTIPRDARSSSETEFLFAGNVGDMQDLEVLVDAASRVVDQGVKITIVGDGVALDRVRSAAENLGATNVTFVGRVPGAEIGTFYERADFALVTLKDLLVFRGTIPSKFQAALAHGVPVVTTVQGDLRGLVDSLGVGFTSDAEDARKLADALLRAASTSTSEREVLSRRAKESHEKMFSVEAGVSAIERVLTRAAESRSSRNQGMEEEPSA